MNAKRIWMLLGLLSFAWSGWAQGVDPYMDDAYITPKEEAKQIAEAKKRSEEIYQERLKAYEAQRAKDSIARARYYQKERDLELEAYNGRLSGSKDTGRYEERYAEVTDGGVYGPYSNRLRRFYGDEAVVMINNPQNVYVYGDDGYHYDSWGYSPSVNSFGYYSWGMGNLYSSYYPWYSDPWYYPANYGYYPRGYYGYYPASWSWTWSYYPYGSRWGWGYSSWDPWYYGYYSPYSYYSYGYGYRDGYYAGYNYSHYSRNPYSHGSRSYVNSTPRYRSQTRSYGNNSRSQSPSYTPYEAVNTVRNRGQYREQSRYQPYRSVQQNNGYRSSQTRSSDTRSYEPYRQNNQRSRSNDSYNSNQTRSSSSSSSGSYRSSSSSSSSSSSTPARGRRR